MFALRGLRYLWVAVLIHVAYIGYWHCHQCAAVAPVQKTAHPARQYSVTAERIASLQCSPCAFECVSYAAFGQERKEQGVPVIPEMSVHTDSQSIATEEPVSLRPNVDLFLPHRACLFLSPYCRRAPPFLA